MNWILDTYKLPILSMYNQLLGAHYIYLFCSWLASLYLRLFLEPDKKEITHHKNK